MFSHKDEGHNPLFVDSQTSSESQGEIGVASEKRVYRHNVECNYSVIGERDLQVIRQRYQIPSSVKMFVPEMGQTADDPPEGCFAVYKIMLKCGLRLPTNDFVNEILTMVRQAPAQICLNSWVKLTAFQVACHVAGVKTSIDLFLYMYRITTSNRDYIYFNPRENKNLTLLNLPKKSRWEPYFFFVSANAFGEKVPSHFCLKINNFKCNRNDIELEYLKLKRKFTRRLLFGAYLDEEVLLSCNIYKYANKRPKEDAYVLLLKVNDALVQSAIAKNNQFLLKLIEDESLRSGIVVEASDVSSAFKPSEPDTKVSLSPKLGGSTSFTTEISRRPLEIASNNESNDLPTRFPFVSSRVKTEKVSTLDANVDKDVEIRDIDMFLGSKKKTSSYMARSVRSSLLASASLKTSEGKRQAETIPEAIRPHLKMKRPNNERTIECGRELATQLFQSSFLPEEIDASMEEEHMETGKMLIKEHKRELGCAPKVSNFNDQDEVDSVSVQLDAILKKGTQSLQETSDHKIQITNILASLDNCHLKASLEKTARQLSNLRDKVELLHSRHDKLVTCLKSYNQLVSDCKSNIEVLNSVRARLETFGLQESPQEISRVEVQVVKLNSILAQIDDSAGRSVELKILLQKSDRQVSAMEDRVGHLIEKNRRFEDAPLGNSKTELESSLNEFNQLEESLKKSAKNVGDLTNQFGQLTSILAQLVVDVEQANSDFKVSSASTKGLYGKAMLQGLGRCSTV